MPKNHSALIGQKFGRLTVVEIVPFPRNNKVRCTCECGGEVTTFIYLLKRGDVKSCGCMKTPHGEHGTRLYWIWRDMIKRCYNTKCDCYKWYGEKGISVCDEWRTSYSNFRDWAKLNGYNDGLTIDRIDPNKNYEPSNCQWLTRSENTAKMQKQKKELKNKYAGGRNER